MSELPSANGPARDPRKGRQHGLANALRVTLGVVLVLSLASVVARSDAGHDLGIAMVAVLAMGPVVRLLWLEVRWIRVGDWRFAGVAGVLLGLIVAATFVGLA